LSRFLFSEFLFESFQDVKRSATLIRSGAFDLSWLEFQTCYAALIGAWSPHRILELRVVGASNLFFPLSNSVILPGCFLSLHTRLFFPSSPLSFDFPSMWSKISRSETRTSEATCFREDKYHGCNSRVLVIACSMVLLSIYG
jgi:hypothetical protein